MLVAQCGAPFLQPEILQHALIGIRQHWLRAATFLTAVPSYYGGVHAFVLAVDRHAMIDVPSAVLDARFAASGIATHHYTPALHHAAFVLPRWITELTLADSHVPRKLLAADTVIDV